MSMRAWGAVASRSMSARLPLSLCGKPSDLTQLTHLRMRFRHCNTSIHLNLEYCLDEVTPGIGRRFGHSRIWLGRRPKAMDSAR